MDLRSSPTLKQAHLQFAQANRTKPKIAKELAFPTLRNCYKILPTLQKIKTNEKETEYGQQITRVWRNGGLSAKFNVSNSITA